MTFRYLLLKNKVGCLLLGGEHVEGLLLLTAGVGEATTHLAVITSELIVARLLVVQMERKVGLGTHILADQSRQIALIIHRRVLDAGGGGDLTNGLVNLRGLLSVTDGNT